MDASSTLLSLEKILRQYNEDQRALKSEFLYRLKNRRFRDAEQVHRFHEALCFLRAYPESPELLGLVNEILDDFSSRSDVSRFKNTLVNTGVAGTPIDYNFFSPMARWLARKWPAHFHIDWRNSENLDKLLEVIPLLLPYAELMQFDDYEFTAREWIDRLKGPEETDATFLKRRLDTVNKGNIYARESLHDRLDLAFRLEAGSTTPSCTHLYHPPRTIHYQVRPLISKRPNLKKVMKELDFTVRYVSEKEGEVLVDLAKATMVTHERDLDAFSYGDKNDVRLINAPDGLQMVCIGTIPEHRYLLPAIYGFLNLKNGVPIGYFQASLIFDIAELAFTTFSTYRGAEAAVTFSKNLAVIHQLFDVNSFILDPYQLGHGNKDGLQSGVWWFYYKFGFRPEDPYVKSVLRGELKEIKRRPGYRSSLATLNELSSDNLYLDMYPKKSDKGVLSRLSSVGRGTSAYLAQHYGFKREAGLRDCVRKANRLLGVHRNHKFSHDEARMWESWAPLILQLTGIKSWSTKDKRELVRVVRAKGGRRESDFVRLFQKHKRLQRSILRYASTYKI
jgi:hypothetical protein